MKYLSVCSGIEAASVAWHPMGWRAAGFSEIEKFPSAVLAHRWPEVPNLGDMTAHHTWPNEPIDLLVGGTPCQAFSFAGLRRGLADPRGNLTLTYLSIVERRRPRWLVWENVPGIFSVEGNPFGAFLRGLAELGYGWAFRVFDAQYFGLAQRRERLFVVGHSGGAWQRSAAVLFERESLRGHPSPSRREGEQVARTITASARKSDRGEPGNLVVVSGTITTRVGEATQYGAETGLLACVPPPIAFSCKDSGHDATVDLTPTMRSMVHAGSHANGGGQLAVCFKPSHYTRNKDGAPSEVSPPLSADADRGDQEPLVFQTRVPTAPTPTCDDDVVRRFTPRECERLQGFADDYTLIPFNGTPAKDSPRYRALGNSMPVPVMRWIGQRIEMVDLLK